MGEPYTPEEIAEIRAVLTDPLAFMLLDDGEQHVTHARWTATVDALSARVDAITKERGRWMERYNGAAVMLASITADRDALAALLKEARYCVESWHDLTGHPVEADLLARIDRALSPSPAAPGTGD